MSGLDFLLPLTSGEEWPEVAMPQSSFFSLPLTLKGEGPAWYSDPYLQTPSSPTPAGPGTDAHSWGPQATRVHVHPQRTTPGPTCCI